MINLDDRFALLDELIEEGRLAEARGLCEKLKSEAGEGAGLRCGVLALYEARILMRMGLLVESLQRARYALEEFRRLDAREWIAWAHLVLSAGHIRGGSYWDGVRHAETAIYYYTWEVDDVERRARAYDFLGLCYKNLGRWVEAEANLRRALEAYGDGYDGLAIFRTMLNLAVVLRKIGKIAEGYELLKGRLPGCLKMSRLVGCRHELELANISVMKWELEEA